MINKNPNRRELLKIIGSLAAVSIGGCQSLQKDSSNIDIDRKIGQMIMAGFRGLEIDNNHSIARDIKKYNLGGVILFDYDVPTKSEPRNIDSAEQIQALTNSLQACADNNLLIAIDQEGGRVCRLKEKYGFEPTVSHKVLGDKNDPEYTRKFSMKTAETLANLGINMNMAPVVDLATNPDNPVIAKLGRSFSADPEIVTRQAIAFIQGHHKKGVACCLKHFPGHGSSKSDSHLGLTDITETWNEIELGPYQNIIKAGNADAIMTGHLFNRKLDGNYPATLSKNILTGILRDKLDYDGVIISDDMQMGAIRQHYGLTESVEKSVLAGVDILLFANNSVYDPDIVPKGVGIIKKMLADNKISEARIDKSYRRVMKLKKCIWLNNIA